LTLRTGRASITKTQNPSTLFRLRACIPRSYHPFFPPHRSPNSRLRPSCSFEITCFVIFSTASEFPKVAEVGLFSHFTSLFFKDHGPSMALLLEPSVDGVRVDILAPRFYPAALISEPFCCGSVSRCVLLALKDDRRNLRAGAPSLTPIPRFSHPPEGNNPLPDTSALHVAISFEVPPVVWMSRRSRPSDPLRRPRWFPAVILHISWVSSSGACRYLFFTFSSWSRP